jgi:hypothetical protein
VPEGMNIEIAHKLTEHDDGGSSKRRWEEFAEIFEAILLAMVAIATAWSGYQAARWDGRQAYLYGLASKYRVEAEGAATAGGQARLLDVSTFNTWIQAESSGNNQLAALYVRRFSPEYRVAFDAWLKTDPFTNQKAPPGPIFMPQYHNALLARSDTLNAQASAAFDEGTTSRDIAERYVRVTVLLATVLFLIALSQRFKLRNVRYAVLTLAVLLMLDAFISIARYPRI